MTGERRLRARRGGAPDVIVAGAGMAGLVAAAEARAAGARVELLEKLPEPGGSMRLSSGVVWRHRDFGAFRAECPSGDERLQRLVFDRLDGDLAWLESLGVRVAERGTGNPRTTGARLDTASPSRRSSARAPSRGWRPRCASCRRPRRSSSRRAASRRAPSSCAAT
jgi:fumarate reductase flavoprotein subunit